MKIRSLIHAVVLTLLIATQAPAVEIGPALQAAAASDAPSFSLQVHRTDRVGQRSLVVFPSGIAIWNRTTQIELPLAVRTSMLEVLQETDFASMLPSYGGRRSPESGEAPLRVTCRVELEIDGLSKSVVQLADGEQSEQLAALADGLLDRAVPFVEGGVTAGDLAEGMQQLADGKLAAEALQLRFVTLPAETSDTEGSILMIRNGEVTKKAYTPGRRIGDEVSRTLTGPDLEALVAALLKADVVTLPVNLWSVDHTELEIQVLGHRKAVVARQFSGLNADEPDAAQQRFERLAAFLLEY